MGVGNLVAELLQRRLRDIELETLTYLLRQLGMARSRKHFDVRHSGGSVRGIGTDGCTPLLTVQIAPGLLTLNLPRLGGCSRFERPYGDHSRIISARG